MSLFPDGPKLSEAGSLDNLTSSPYIPRTRGKTEKKNITHKCRCEKFILDVLADTEVKFDGTFRYCKTCGHVQKWHNRNSGKCSMTWIEKNVTK